MTGSETLHRVLSFQDLIGFGLAAIMGSGGFNLIGDGIIAGGSQFPIALAAVAALFQGTSLTYQQAYNEFKTNTSESDLIKKEFGDLTSNLSAIAILIFQLISTSVVIVVCTNLLFPNTSWSGKISFSLFILASMTGIALQGIEVGKEFITAAGLSIVGLLSFVTMIGLVEVGTKGMPAKLPSSLDVKPNIVHSILYFYFVLAGFDTLIKFAEESKNPDKDFTLSFYVSNAVSALLTIGVCFAFVVLVTNQQFKENDNIISRIVGVALGAGAEKTTQILSIGLMIITAFVSFLACTRYMFSLAKDNSSLDFLRQLNEARAPWKAICLSTFVIGVGILLGNVYELVKIADIGLTVTLLLVSAAATKMQAAKGKTPWIEGLTTAGLGALLSACIMYR
jgi:APA family basic amino acid/polyamine antiporter